MLLQGGLKVKVAARPPPGTFCMEYNECHGALAPFGVRARDDADLHDVRVRGELCQQLDQYNGES